MKKSIFKLAFFAVLTVFCATNNANAHLVKNDQYYSVDSQNIYRYEWHENEQGDKWTEWTYNFEPQIRYNGHVVPGPGIVFIAENTSYKTEAGIYEYKWLKNGKKEWTVWSFNGEPQKNYEGFVVPGRENIKPIKKRLPAEKKAK